MSHSTILSTPKEHSRRLQMQSGGFQAVGLFSQKKKSFLKMCLFTFWSIFSSVVLTEMKENNIRAPCVMKHIKPQLFRWIKTKDKGMSLLKLGINDQRREY